MKIAAEQQSDPDQRPEELAQHGVARTLGCPCQPGPGRSIGPEHGQAAEFVGRTLADQPDVGDAVALRQIDQHRAGHPAIADDVNGPDAGGDHGIDHRFQFADEKHQRFVPVKNDGGRAIAVSR